MTEDQRELLEEARDSIAAARLLLDGGFPGYAASRAYYAMFYVAEALLEDEELSEMLGGRKVDLRAPQDLSRYFREEVLDAAAVQYAQG
jgi:hypothetical protein